MEEYVGYIYSITNELNGKTYIGKTNNLVRRWKEHCCGHGGTAILDKALKKYGLEHFVFDIVAQIPFNSMDELNDALAKLEVYYIVLYDTYNNGYNATIGGEGTSGYKQSPETTEKIRQANKGRIVTEEQKEKSRIANLGKHHTDKAREAIRQALLHRDHSVYEKSSAKLKGKTRDHDMIMRGAVKRRKPILQYDMEGNFIREFEGASHAGFGRGTSITACCKGRLASSCGYIWRYKESKDFPRKIIPPTRWDDRKRAVSQYDKNGTLIATFNSISDASRATGITTSNICQCLSGIYNFTKGFMWKYVEGKEVQYA